MPFAKLRWLNPFMISLNFYNCFKQNFVLVPIWALTAAHSVLHPRVYHSIREILPLTHVFFWMMPIIILHIYSRTPTPILVLYDTVHHHDTFYSLRIVWHIMVFFYYKQQRQSLFFQWISEYDQKRNYPWNHGWFEQQNNVLSW